MKLLVTRPEPGASATTARLAMLGHEAIALPCLTIAPVAPHLPQHPAALLVTSGQAIPALPARLRNVPVFCVGDATAAKLRMAGFTSVESANGDAEALASLVLRRNLPGLHVLATGERLGQKLMTTLRASGISIVRRKVYKVTTRRTIPDSICTALKTGYFDGVLFYSAETARAFLRLNPPRTDRLKAYALSQNIEKGLQLVPWNAIHVACAPTEADLMALLA